MSVSTKSLWPRLYSPNIKLLSFNNQTWKVQPESPGKTSDASILPETSGSKYWYLEIDLCKKITGAGLHAGESRQASGAAWGMPETAKQQTKTVRRWL